jgi:hypothetical protein
MQDHGPTFYFQNQPVGFLADPAKPVAPGKYVYMPLRSLGHLRFHQTLKEDKMARVSFVFDGSEIELEVVACSPYGVLEVRSINSSPVHGVLE